MNRADMLYHVFTRAQSCAKSIESYREEVAKKQAILKEIDEIKQDMDTNMAISFIDAYATVHGRSIADIEEDVVDANAKQRAAEACAMKNLMLFTHLKTIWPKEWAEMREGFGLEENPAILEWIK